MKIFRVTIALTSLTIFIGCPNMPNEFIELIPPPETPTLSSASIANGAINVSISPILEWNESSGAESYTFQVSTSNLFTSIFYNQSGVMGTSLQITGLSNLTTYYWHVSATNGSGTSDWSSTWSFTTTGTAPSIPQLSSPVNEATGESTNPTLMWNASTNGISYTLQVSINNSFSSFVYNQAAITDTSKEITGLSNSTTYFWRVTSTNNYGTSDWSNVWNFTTAYATCPGLQTVTYSDKTYNTVLIGEQCWLKENLDIGSMIRVNETAGNNGIIEKYYYYNDSSNYSEYGALYQWNEAMQYVSTEGARGICPAGWHIPTKKEFETLVLEVNNEGNSLKSQDQGTGVGTGTNTSNFSALLAGYRSTDGSFYHLSNETYLWSSTEYSNSNSNFLALYWDNSNIKLNENINKEFGFSVRCIKNGDNTPDSPSLNSPANDATSQSISPTLSWNESPGANSYTLQVSTNSSFTSFIYNQSGLTRTSKQLNDLNNSTKYYWRVTASNGSGTSDWSNTWSFRTIYATCPGLPSITYIAKTYNTVQIGDQCWLQENLDVGSMILANGNASNNGVIEKYCYNSDEHNCFTYGGLYQWDEAMQYVTIAGTRGICPEGWHIPSIEEFQTLAEANSDGNVLKAIGQGIGNGAGTNLSGFSALFSGIRAIDNLFTNIGYDTYIWSSTAFNTTDVYVMYMYYLNNNILLDHYYGKNFGFSVRCLRGDGISGSIPEIPNLSNPMNGSTDESITPTLSWNLSNGATSYTLQVSTDDNSTNIVYNKSGLSGTSERITGLSNSTTYYWRVCAINNYGASDWSSTWSFTTVSGELTGEPCPGISTITYESKTYNTVQIGEQCWLKENLDVGMMILSSQDANNNGTVEKYCYDNNPTNCETYGGLYQWNEAMQYSTTPATQGICPTGWHIPLQSEFKTLEAAVNNDGNSLKAIGQGTGSGAGTNTSGFSAVLAGYRDTNGSFGSLFGMNIFWLSSELGSDRAYRMSLDKYSSTLFFSDDKTGDGFTIRCLKDIGSSPQSSKLFK